MLRLVFPFILSAFTVSAQEGPVSSGNTISGIGGSISFSTGQVVYQYQEGSGGTVNQGIQQPFELFTVGTDDFPSIQLEVSIAPNPVVDALKLTINQWMDGLQFTLFDDQGRIIFCSDIKDDVTLIDMNLFPPANYLLAVAQHDQKLKTFKIIKH